MALLEDLRLKIKATSGQTYANLAQIQDVYAKNIQKGTAEEKVRPRGQTLVVRLIQ